jgi:hypothetical protein
VNGADSEQERTFGWWAIELLSVFVAVLDDRAVDDVRALMLELVSVEEAGRICASYMRAAVAPVTLAEVQLAWARGVHGEEAIGDAVRPTVERALTPRLVLTAMRPALVELLDLYDSRRPGGATSVRSP